MSHHLASGLVSGERFVGIGQTLAAQGVTRWIVQACRIDGEWVSDLTGLDASRLRGRIADFTLRGRMKPAMETVEINDRYWESSRPEDWKPQGRLTTSTCLPDSWLAVGFWPKSVAWRHTN